MSWLVTPPGQALPSAGSVTDNGATPPGLSMAIPEEWGTDPALWPTDWMDQLPTTEAFRYTRTPVDVLPPYEQIPIGSVGLRLTPSGRFYAYALTRTFSGATTVRLPLPGGRVAAGVRLGAIGTLT